MVFNAVAGFKMQKAEKSCNRYIGDRGWTLQAELTVRRFGSSEFSVSLE